MLLLVAFAISAEQAPLSERALRDCGAAAGPVSWATKSDTDRWAIACSRGELTRLTVFAKLPSGQQGAICELANIAGIPHELQVERVKDTPLVWLRTVARTPEEERVVEQVISPHWGHCNVVAESDVRHPTDGPTLLEPRAGIRIDSDGVDAWQGVSRLYFGTPRRHVATALHGTRYQMTSGSFSSEPVDAAMVEALPVTFPNRLLAHEATTVEWSNEARVRGLKLRLHEAHKAARLLVLETDTTTITWRDNDTAWQTSPGVFGAGFLPRAAGDETREAIVFFEPPQPLKHIVLRGGDTAIDIVAAQIFVDADGFDLFEPSEDFGENVELPSPQGG